jgi:hypothetical protein
MCSLEAFADRCVVVSRRGATDLTARIEGFTASREDLLRVALAARGLTLLFVTFELLVAPPHRSILRTTAHFAHPARARRPRSVWSVVAARTCAAAAAAVAAVTWFVTGMSV